MCFGHLFLKDSGRCPDGGLDSIGSSGWVGGARNMKSVWPPLVAIFFMTYLYRAGGPWPPRIPPGSATGPSSGKGLVGLKHINELGGGFDLQQ